MAGKKILINEYPVSRQNPFYQSVVADSGIWALWEALKDYGYDLVPEGRIGDTVPDYVLHQTFAKPEWLERYPKAIHLYLGWEPHIVRPYDSVFILNRLTHIYDAVVSCDLPQRYVHGRLYTVNVPFLFVDGAKLEIPWDSRKLACLISGDKILLSRDELYSHRRKVIRWFERNHPEEFGFYGRGWMADYQNFKTYQGESDCKLRTYAQYRFAFCFENCKREAGCVSEKIFDCFVAGIVPIYKGSDEIQNFVPKECYIDGWEFSTTKEIYDFIKNMPQERYEMYLQAARDYMASDLIKKVSPKEQAQKMHRILVKTTGSEGSHDVGALKRIVWVSEKVIDLWRYGVPSKLRKIGIEI